MPSATRAKIEAEAGRARGGVTRVGLEHPDLENDGEQDQQEADRDPDLDAKDGAENVDQHAGDQVGDDAGDAALDGLEGESHGAKVGLEGIADDRQGGGLRNRVVGGDEGKGGEGHDGGQGWGESRKQQDVADEGERGEGNERDACAEGAADAAADVVVNGFLEVFPSAEKSDGEDDDGGLGEAEVPEVGLEVIVQALLDELGHEGSPEFLAHADEEDGHEQSRGGGIEAEAGEE
jgi:hypothetical protein